MEKIRELVTKYRSYILYIIFGALTTLVNMAVYALCYQAAGIANVPSVIIAWIVSVAFAFVTNKIWVFESKAFNAETLKREVPAFFGARIATGVLDVGIMYLAVDVLQGSATIWKLISNVIVIIINYFASKLFVFRKKEQTKEEKGGKQE